MEQLTHVAMRKIPWNKGKLVLGATIIRGAPEVIWELALLTLGVPAYLVFRRIYTPAAVTPLAAGRSREGPDWPEADIAARVGIPT
jgi:hypothetical protein